MYTIAKYEAVPVLLGKVACGADDLVDQRRQRHDLRIELEFSRFHLREVEHLVDETQQVVCQRFVRGPAAPAPFRCIRPHAPPLPDFES